jgi:hypothetical protein
MKRILAAGAAVLVLGAAALAPAAHADQTYTVLMAKGPAGTLEITTGPGGTERTTYQYTDRGRGPSTVTEERFNADGVATGLTVTGVDYLKAPVSERFNQLGGSASWTSGADEGTVTANGRAYFPAVNNSEDLAVLARRLLAAPGHELDLLPGGHVRISVAGHWPPVCDGKCPPATLYLIEGLAFEPSPIWLMDSDRSLFFEGASWISTIPKGQEGYAPQLIALQSKALADRSAAVAKTLQRRPSGPVVFVHATLFDSESRKLVPHTTVVVRGNKIEAVGADGAVATPAGAEVIDAQGKTLMPGLVDMHVHLASDPDGILDILSGVTTVRDLGNDMDELLARRKRFADGTQIGPRIWLGCLVDGPGPFAGPTKMLISTPDEAHAAVKLCFDDGFEQMKIYSSVDPKLVPVIIADAHARGMRVSGHVPAGMIMEEAVADGYDEVQHANFWFLNFMGPDVTAKTNTRVRLSATGEHAKDLDLSSPPVARFIALLQAHHTVVDPTLGAFEDDFLGALRKPAPTLAAVYARLPPVVARSVTGGGLATTDAQRADYAASFARMLEMTKKLHDAGIVIVAGTDGLAGLPLAHELEDYVQAGIASDEVLQIATLGAARVMRHDAEQGSIAPGKFADLILIDGDPVAHISEIRRVVLVMKDGVIYDPDAIARAAGMRPLSPR